MSKLLKLILIFLIIQISLSAASTTPSIEKDYEWGALEIGGGGFVSGIVTGQKEMYLRTDVGGAYKYDYTKREWVQLLAFLNEAQKGFLSVSGIAIDPTDDDTVYFLCGCAYFSEARTAIYKTTDGGKTFTEIDVTDMIQVHGNGNGRECAEPISVDPDDHLTIYAGGDVTAGESCLIKSNDGGKTWNYVLGYDKLGFFQYSIKWPTWTDHMARATINGDYYLQNGIDFVKIYGGKVYVGTAVKGEANIHVADVGKDDFKVLSKDLPTANYPLSVTDDGNGNLYFTYIATLDFGGGSGGAYKYNTKTGEVTNVSPVDKAIGMITADKTNPKKLVARTCGVWLDQWYEKEWTDGSIAWGDYFYSSEDGGATWKRITPGTMVGQYTDNSYFISLPIDTNGYKWIYGKAIHWGSSIVLDPRNSDKILMTSGNGVFACDNVWQEKDIQFYFDPKGIEEVVALDFVSVKDGKCYSAIGDYDGYIHSKVDEIGIQYTPNMGSTSVIAVCRQDPKVLARFATNDGSGYYSQDGGETWTKMKNTGGTGGKGAITKLGTKYRIFHSTESGINYSDDFGDNWSKSTGLVGTKEFGILVEESDPNIVYAYSAKYNAYWSADPNKKEPTLDDAQIDLGVSKDGGATFTNHIVSFYDQCDIANRIAYLGEGTIVIAVGWYGAYISNDFGSTFTKLDSVFYCKTIGYGAPEKEGKNNTLYMYGKPLSEDPEGLYRSTDDGQSWVLINTQHLYGGTGNGNFLVGDMNTFGMVYMSTVGCGIVYGRLS